MCVCLCAEWNIPVPPVHALRNEVQSDVQGQPDRTHSGGGIAEHLSSWGEWGLRYSCCHKGDTCNNTLTCLHTHPHTHQCIKAPCLATLSISVTCVYLKGRVRNTRSRVQPCLQDKITFSFHCLSFRYTLSLLLELPSCYSPALTLLLLRNHFPSSLSSWICKNLMWLIMTSCIFDEGTHQQPPSLYITPPLNSLSCFLMVLHSCLLLFSICLCCLPACFGGCPKKWITKLACWLNAIKTHCRCVACVIVNQDNLNL